MSTKSLYKIYLWIIHISVVKQIIIDNVLIANNIYILLYKLYKLSVYTRSKSNYMNNICKSKHSISWILMRETKEF